jgi:hypothetical protein
MIVVGSFGPDAPAGMLVGSTALTLIARAGCPVAVIRGARRGLPPPRGGPILAGADGTPASDDALDVSADLAASLGAPLVSVHAWSGAGSDPAGGVHRAARGSPGACRHAEPKITQSAPDPRSATDRSPTGPSTPPSASPWTAVRTCWGCGWAAAEREGSRPCCVGAAGHSDRAGLDRGEGEGASGSGAPRAAGLGDSGSDGRSAALRAVSDCAAERG